jgi:hypothetical protein
MATGNHFWLDIVAGLGIAVVGGTIVSWAQEGRFAASPALYPCRQCSRW